MSIYDILMLIVFFGAIFFGWWKGLAWQVASFASVCVSYFVAYNFHGAVSPYLEIAYPWNKFGAMLILFLGTSLVIWIGFGYVRSSIDKMKLDGFDHQSGAVLGAIKGALLCMLVTLFAVTLLPDSFSNNIIHSRSGNFIARSLNQLSLMVPEEIHAVLSPKLNELNQSFAAQGKNPTAPLTLDNRSNWFEVEGTPTINRDPFAQGIQTIEGQFSNQRFTNQQITNPPINANQASTSDNNWPNVNFQRPTGELIDRGFEAIGQGIERAQNR